MKKEYLGDSVYAEINAYGDITLTTENGQYATNEIYLEPQVVEALINYYNRVKK